MAITIIEGANIYAGQSYAKQNVSLSSLFIKYDNTTTIGLACGGGYSDPSSGSIVCNKNGNLALSIYANRRQACAIEFRELEIINGELFGRIFSC